MRIVAALLRALLRQSRPPAPYVPPVPLQLSSGHASIVYHGRPVPRAPIGDATHFDLGDGLWFHRGVVGESFRQPALKALDAGRLRRGQPVMFITTLTPEADFDPTGIRVDIQGGAQVGYLARDEAPHYQAAFAALAARHLVGVARAMLIGGVRGKPTIGVVLDMHRPAALLRALGLPPAPHVPRRPRVKKVPVAATPIDGAIE